MTLKEKFGELYVDNTLADECEKIADDFAIGFVEYLSDWYTKKRIKELLEIYKKEKGL
jgi:response regulator of citrate/malate metabolism